METSLKTGSAQIFSCCPKNLSCPKFGGAAAPRAPQARTPMGLYHLRASNVQTCYRQTFNRTPTPSVTWFIAIGSSELIRRHTIFANYSESMRDKT